VIVLGSENSVWLNRGSVIDNLLYLVNMSFSYQVWIAVEWIIPGVRIILNYQENVSYYIGHFFQGLN
jgi:hypothetical protein